MPEYEFEPENQFDRPIEPEEDPYILGIEYGGETETPGFEPDEESRARADAFTNQLIQDLKIVLEEGAHPEVMSELFSQRRYADRSEGVPIADVVENVAQMAAQFALFSRLEMGTPCVPLNDGSEVPISIWGIFGLPRHYPHVLFGREYVLEALRSYGQYDQHLTLTDVGEATENARGNVGTFLSYRFAGMKLWNALIRRFGDLGSGAPQMPLPRGVGAGGGLQVEVFCSTPGLRIHVSPAIFIDWVFFGSPTFPATSYVLPGRYIFAGDGPMLPKWTRDDGVFKIPPTYQPRLTRF
jgi:hypothetical protein